MSDNNTSTNSTNSNHSSNNNPSNHNVEIDMPIHSLEEKTCEYLTLVSAEGNEFVIDKRAACLSKMIKEIVEQGGGPFGEEDRISFSEISSPVLELICQFLTEKLIRGTSLTSFKPVQNLNPSETTNRNLVVELLLAANYLDC